jgi:hypothetical protein
MTEQAKPDPFVRSWLLLSLREWSAVGIVVMLVLTALEVYLRSDALWRVPLPYLLPYANDRHVMVSWEIHQPRPGGVREVMAFGSSVAAAVTELPGGEADAYLRELTADSRLQFRVMAVPRGCFDEMAVILENLIARERAPAAAILFTWPGCFLAGDERAMRLAELMPLRTEWLADGRDSWSLSDRVSYTAVQHVAVLRYRHMFNAWIRRRFDAAVFDGERRLAIPYRPYRQTTPAEVPLEQLRGFDRYSRYPAAIEVDGPSMQRLRALLDRLRAADVPTILVENPWSPPIKRVLAEAVPRYRQAMQALSADHGVPYVDPNAAVDLTGQFNDLLHPTSVGGARYFRAIAPHVVELLP